MISISSRIRNSMLVLSLILCVFFAVLLFLQAYMIEDRLLLNQFDVEKQHFEKTGAYHKLDTPNSNIQIYLSLNSLPEFLPDTFKSQLVKHNGVREYYDDHHAVFVESGMLPESGQQYFLVYDVFDLLVVKNSKLKLFITISLVGVLAFSLAIVISNRLSRTTLLPLKRLSVALKKHDIDDAVIDLAKAFSDDEVGTLAKSLAIALKQAREAAKREFEFNQGVSHELRSPIQVARSTAELLELSASNAQHKYIQRFKRSAEEMNETVEAFLWLASDRRACVSDRSSITDLQVRVQEIASSRPNIYAVFTSEVSLKYEYPLPRHTLYMLVRSLMHNAISHGVSDEIHIKCSEGALVISNKIDPSSQASSGFEMGLAIVQRICNRFDCGLHVDKTKPDTFRVEIKFP